MQENCTLHLFTTNEYCLAVDLSVVHSSVYSQTNSVFIPSILLSKSYLVIFQSK